MYSSGTLESRPLAGAWRRACWLAARARAEYINNELLAQRAEFGRLEDCMPRGGAPARPAREFLPGRIGGGVLSYIILKTPKH